MGAAWTARSSLALAYLLVRAMHFLMFWLVAREDEGLRGQLTRFAPSVAGSSVVPDLRLPVPRRRPDGVVGTGPVVDYVGTWLGGASGWRLPSPGHFSERHGLIVIIALGESIVAIGVGVADAADHLADPRRLRARPLLASAMWWAYFDVSALIGEEALAAEPVETRARLATYGVHVRPHADGRGDRGRALGLKKVLEYVTDTEHHDLYDPLKGVALGALFVGVVVYLLANVAFKWLVARELTRSGSAPPPCSLALWLPIEEVPALAQLGVSSAGVVVAPGRRVGGVRRPAAEIRADGPTLTAGAEGVVWDLGNVLIDWQPLEAVAAGMGEAEARRFLTADDFDFMAWNHMQDAGGSWADAEASVVRSHPQWADHALAYRANFTASLVGEVPGTVDLVRELHAAGVPMWGLTNWSARALSRTPRSGSRSSTCSTSVVVSGTEGVAKPDAGIFEIVVARSGLPASSLVFVDDRDDNVAAANACGLDGVVFTGATDLRTALRERGLPSSP